MKKKELDKPTFIYRDGMTADKDYVQWLHEVKLRYRQSQVKAAVRVNTAMLEFYWGMGRDIVAMQAEVKWGSGFFNQLSLDMKAEFPNETGFSVTNLKYMKRWYNFYYQHVAICQRGVDELPEEKSQRVVDFLQSIQNTVPLEERESFFESISAAFFSSKTKSLSVVSTAISELAYRSWIVSPVEAAATALASEAYSVAVVAL